MPSPHLSARARTLSHTHTTALSFKKKKDKICSSFFLKKNERKKIVLMSNERVDLGLQIR
jgi:hypothetical protein